MPRWDMGSRKLTVAVGTAVGLVVGLVIGVLVGGTDLLDRHETATRVPVATGVIRQVENDVRGFWGFELPVFNNSDARVDVGLVGFADVASGLTSTPARHVAPGTWGAIRFSTTANCDRRPPAGGITEVRLRLRTPSGSSAVSVPVHGGKALLDYYETICRGGGLGTVAQLLGVWSLETVYGQDTELTGRLLLHFEKDGRFTADDVGELFTGDAALRGTYRVKNDLVTITARSGTACRVGEQGTWRVTMVEANVLSMVWLRGDCPDDEPGDAWVVRRVLNES